MVCVKREKTVRLPPNQSAIFWARPGQTVQEHLEQTSRLAASIAAKVGLSNMLMTCGLLHDLGKFSQAFQDYLASALAQANCEGSDPRPPVVRRGEVDHSTAGAQFASQVADKDQHSLLQRMGAEMISLCVAGHHAGLLDCISPAGEKSLDARLGKSHEKTHVAEAAANCPPELLGKIQALMQSGHIGKEIHAMLFQAQMGSKTQLSFNVGILTRLVFSILIDADRMNSAEPALFAEQIEDLSNRPPWPLLVDRLESNLGSMPSRSKIDPIRKRISEQCAKSADREKGLYLLTVPTGGGKTLASLRFALRHAKKYGMDRVFYIIPYTSIIEQNAAVARTNLEDSATAGRLVLEHHSNLTPEQETEQNRLMAENWDAPIVFTTTVQFLDALFGSGTRGARRMHQMANAVIIFDEVQTLPLKCIHLFNNAINFLVGACGCTALFCTATQPVLDKVDAQKGAANLSKNPEIMEDLSALFKELNRVRIVDKRRTEGWNDEAISALAIDKLNEHDSVLVVVNTTKAARTHYEACRIRLSATDSQAKLFHLSARMCPAHRKCILDAIRQELSPDNPKPVPILCFSTQLIEAGVDVDFNCVIRYLAGMDSIAQAAGRCNRHGRRPSGEVLVVNSQNDNPPGEIKIGQRLAERVLDQFIGHPDLLNPSIMEEYFRIFFHDRAEQMSYPVRTEKGIDTQLLGLLGENPQGVSAYKRIHRAQPDSILHQAFKTAAGLFAPIEAPTRGIIVPYGDEGKAVIAELCASFNRKHLNSLMRKAQVFSVNIYPDRLARLMESHAIYEVQAESGVFYLDEQYYSNDFGVDEKIVRPADLLHQ